MRRGCLAALVLAGCGGPRHTTNAPAPSVAVSAPAPTPEAPLPAPREPPLAEISEPADVGCKLASDSWSFEQLRLKAGGTVFAKVRAAPSSVLLPVVQKATFATAVFDDGEVTIRAVIDAADLGLHPVAPSIDRGPVTLLGILWPQAVAYLYWEATTKERLKVSIETDVLTPSPTVDDLLCDRLGLDTAEFEVRPLITKKNKLPTRWVVDAGADIQRSLTHEPAARVLGGVEMEVLEVRGKMTKVLYDSAFFVVVGWVRSSDLTTTQTAGPGFGLLASDYGRGIPTFEGDDCGKDLPLVVEMGSERARVGTIRAGSSFRIVDKNELSVSIELPRQDWFQLQKPAHFTIPVSELGDCAR